MNTSPEFEKTAEEFFSPGPSESIYDLYTQICEFCELRKSATVVDGRLLNRLQVMKDTASLIIDQFQVQKEGILNRFDNWIYPIAQDVLDELLSDLQQLQIHLEHKINHLEKTTVEEWEMEAQSWAQFYANWNDRNALINKILEMVVDRTTNLINRDIKVVQDYQNQSLARLSQESDAFRNVEYRLSQAIEEPLKQLTELKAQAKEHISLQQASEWVASLQERRENYFDQLLMKIDHVMKDVIHHEEAKEWSNFAELEGEIVFMERELRHIKEDMGDMDEIDESDLQFMLGRLEGLLEHVLELEKHRLPFDLQLRMNSLKAGISVAISRCE